MLNCTDFDSLCEEGTAVTKAGECDALSGLCLCPEGWSGFDDWRVTNDCSVNDGTQRALWRAVQVVSVVAFLWTCIGWQYMLRHKWGGRQLMTRTKSQAQLVMEASSQLDVDTGAAAPPTPMQSRRMLKLAKRQRERKQVAALLLASLTLYELSWMGLSTSFLQGSYRWEGNVKQDFALAIGTSAMFSGFWAFFLLWYLQLPSIKHFGRLFGVEDSILVRQPRLVKNSVYGRIVAISIFFFLLLLVGPAADSSTEARDVIDQVYLVANAVFIIDFIIFGLALCRLLIKLYSQLLVVAEDGGFGQESFQVGARNSKAQALSRAIFTIRLYVLANFTLGPPSPVLFFISVLGRLPIYLTVNIFLLNSLCSAIWGTYMVMFRLSGAKTSRAGSGPSEGSVTDSSSETSKL